MAGGTEIRNIVYNIRSLTAKETSKIITALNKKWGNLNKKVIESRKNIADFNSELVYTIDELAEVVKHVDKLDGKMDGLAGGSKAAANALNNISRETDQLVKAASASSKTLNAMLAVLNDMNGTAVSTASSTAVTEEAIERMGKQSSRSGKKVDKLGNQLKQAGNKGKGAAKQFSGLTSALGGGGLLGAYAALAATLFVLDTAFRGLKESADLTRLEENIASLGNGRNLRGLAVELQNVAEGSLSADSALRLAAQSAAFSFDAETITKFTKQAKQASIALGIDFNDALTRLTKGIAKQEVELLDELGIVTRLEPAMIKYAASIGKTVKQLTDVERKTALATEASLQLERAYGDINITSTEYERVSANLATVTRQLGKSLAETLEPVLGVINRGFENYIRNLGEVSKVEGDISAANTAKGLVANANAFKGAREAVDYYLDSLATLEAVEFRLKGQALVTIENRQKLNRVLAEQVEASKGLEEALASLAKVEGEGKGKTSDQVKELENLQKQYKQSEGTITQFGLATKKALVSYSDELEFAKGLAKTLGDTYAEQGAKSLETDKERDKLLKAINSSYGTAFTSVQQYANAVQKASNSATGFAKTNQLIDASNWMLKESVSTQERIGVLEGRITDEKARGNAIGVKALEAQKLTSSLALEAQKRQEKKLGYDTLFAHNQTLALTTARAQGALESETLAIQISFLDKRLEAESAVLTVLEKQAIERQKEQLLQQQIIASVKEGTLIGGSAAMTGLFGNKELAQNQVNKDLGNDEAVMANGAEGVQTALDALAQLDTATGSIANGFMDLGKIMAQSMQNGSFGADAAAASIGAVGGILQGQSQQAVNAIDHQIAMEKKRDGQSAKSVAKIKQLEAKKLKEQQKAKLQSAVMATAAGIAEALTLPFPMNLVAAGITGAMGLMQVSAIRSQGKNASALANAGSSGAQSISFGDRMNNVDLSKSSSAGERAFVTGAAGSGTSANNFTGASAGRDVDGGTAIQVGERGAEVFVPEVPGSIIPSGNTGSGTGGKGLQISMQIDNIDAQSFIDRQEDIMEALEAAVQAKYGKSLEDI